MDKNNKHLYGNSVKYDRSLSDSLESTFYWNSFGAEHLKIHQSRENTSPSSAINT
jgi:hypothetical protein